MKERAGQDMGATPPSSAPPGQPRDWEQELGVLAAAYSGTTQVGQLEGAQDPGSHFIVLRYAARESESLLRPFVTGPEPTGLISPDRLQDMIDHVIGMDQLSHPEWFA